ncbi:MAG: hypothetical protein ACFB4J_01080 [Elainellaceae cyanobacterium]
MRFFSSTLDSVSNDVVHHAPCPVVVAHKPAVRQPDTQSDHLAAAES